MLPDFIIIGAMKSGTTSLYYYLKAHPQIGMSAIKETDFFIDERNYSKGLEWYKSQFTGDYKIYGEASPNYTKAHYFKGVPKRMYEIVPNTKLIYIVRDPVERIISHYTHNCGAGRESENMSNTFQNRERLDHYLNSSKYFWQIKHYLNYYSREQILIIPSDKLRKQRESTLEDVFRFLGVDSILETDLYKKEFGTTDRRTSKGRTGRLIFDNAFVKFLKRGIPPNFKRKLKQLLLPSLEKPTEITPVLRYKLEEALRSDAEAFRSIAGQEFKEWTV